MSSPHVGVSYGEMWRHWKHTKTPPYFLAGFVKYLVSLCDLGLYQAKFRRPFDSRPAAIDVEFAVDALGMRADCA